MGVKEITNWFNQGLNTFYLPLFLDSSFSEFSSKRFYYIIWCEKHIEYEIICMLFIHIKIKFHMCSSSQLRLSFQTSKWKLSIANHKIAINILILFHRCIEDVFWYFNIQLLMQAYFHVNFVFKYDIAIASYSI